MLEVKIVSELCKVLLNYVGRCFPRLVLMGCHWNYTEVLGTGLFFIVATQLTAENTR